MMGIFLINGTWVINSIYVNWSWLCSEKKVAWTLKIWCYLFSWWPTGQRSWYLHCRIWLKGNGMELKHLINSSDFEKHWIACLHGWSWLLTLFEIRPPVLLCRIFFEDFDLNTWQHCVVWLRNIKSSEEVSGSQVSLLKGLIKSLCCPQLNSQVWRGIVSSCGWWQIFG